jgi:hypothetical protein
MSSSDRPHDNVSPDADGSAAPKKPYTKPEFLHERVFETMALACGKVNPSQLQCRFVRKNS